MIDKSAVENERAEVSASLAGFVDAFEKGFSRVIPPPPASQIASLSHILLNPTEVQAQTEAKIYTHKEVMGFGESGEKAFEDFRAKLIGPSGDKILYWRVLPEIACERDFSTDKVLWKVYARYALIDCNA